VACYENNIRVSGLLDLFDPIFIGGGEPSIHDRTTKRRPYCNRLAFPASACLYIIIIHKPKDTSYRRTP
jgi:hypothetical protein